MAPPRVQVLAGDDTGLAHLHRLAVDVHGHRPVLVHGQHLVLGEGLGAVLDADDVAFLDADGYDLVVLDDVDDELDFVVRESEVGQVDGLSFSR